MMRERSESWREGLDSVRNGDRMSLDTIVQVLPRWSRSRGHRARIELVSGTTVEEVLQEIGVLDFGKGMTAVADVALWRNRGDHSPLIGEFAFQIKFKRREDLNERALTRGVAFLLSLQDAAPRIGSPSAPPRRAWCTGLKGNPPHAHE